MSRIVKKTTTKKEEQPHPYLTKRALTRAITKGTRDIFETAIRTRGHAVKVIDGWVVRINSNGTSERISKVPVVNSTPDIALD